MGFMDGREPVSEYQRHSGRSVTDPRCQKESGLELSSQPRIGSPRSRSGSFSVLTYEKEQTAPETYVPGVVLDVYHQRPASASSLNAQSARAGGVKLGGGLTRNTSASKLPGGG